jgi:hypothetical protein
MIRQTIAAVSFALVAGPAFPAEAGMEKVAEAGDCPAGTTPLVNYEWRDRRLMRSGWACRPDSTH